MEPTPTYARLNIEHRAEGALVRLTLSREALRELQDRSDLDLRDGDDGVSFVTTGISMSHGSEGVKPVRIEVHVLPEQPS